jgi:hypothetical protein
MYSTGRSFTIGYAHRHIPKDRQAAIRRYFSGRSYFDAAGNEYKIVEVIFIERTSMLCPHTDIIIDYDFIEHSDMVAVYTPILSHIEKTIVRYYFWEVPNHTVVFGIDNVTLWEQQRYLKNYYIDEYLRSQKYVCGLPNLFYCGESLTDAQNRLFRKDNWWLRD